MSRDSRVADREAAKYLKDARVAKGYAHIRSEILKARDDVNATITPDGKRLRKRNLFRYRVFGPVLVSAIWVEADRLASPAYLQTWFTEMAKRGGLKP